MSKPNLYFYWEGPMPDFIRLCIKTIYRNCQDSFNLHFIKPERLFQYTTVPEEYFEMTSPNHKTDYLKAKLIYENGGFWIDCDTIVLRDFSDWSQLFNGHDFIGTPGFFGGPEGSTTIGDWLHKMDSLLKIKQKFTWSELIDPLITRMEYDPFKVLTKKQFCPYWYDDAGICNFFANKKPGDEIGEETKVVILFNACFPDDFKKKSEEQILNDNTLIRHLFDIGLGRK